MEPVRRELLDALAKLSELYPQVRLGQFIANFTSSSEGPYRDSVYDIEDEELLESVRRILQHAARD